jgi:hypothetical protein
VGVEQLAQVAAVLKALVDQVGEVMEDLVVRELQEQMA